MEARYIIRCVVAHDYVMFEKVIGGTIKDQIQIPIVEFYDIFQKLSKSEMLTSEHVAQYLPDYNRIEIYEDSWCTSRDYLSTNSNH